MSDLRPGEPGYAYEKVMAERDALARRVEALRAFVEWVKTEFALDDRLYWPAKNELTRDDESRGLSPAKDQVGGLMSIPPYSAAADAEAAK